MQHRTKVIQTTTGQIGICSCGYVTPRGTNARLLINDHEATALESGVHVTHLDPAQTELPGVRKRT